MVVGGNCHIDRGGYSVVEWVSGAVDKRIFKTFHRRSGKRKYL